MNDTAAAPDLSPIQRSISVGCSIERAFEVFTAGIDAWWPRVPFSVGGPRARTVVLEGRLDGRIYEVMDGGEESEWGRVAAWDPPHRIVFTWYPGSSRPASTEVEVRFTAEGERTRLDLEHRGWEARAAEAPEARGSYAGGWTVVLDRFAEKAGSVPA